MYFAYTVVVVAANVLDTYQLIYAHTNLIGKCLYSQALKFKF